MQRGKNLLKLVVVFALVSAAPSQEVQQLVQQLGSDDPEVREAAQAKLEVLPDTSVPEIEKFFDHPNPEIRQRVRSVLRKKDSILFLTRDMAKDDIPGNAERARKIVVHRYEAERARFLPHLINMVGSSDVQQSFYGAFILISKGDAAEIDRAFPNFWKTAINNYLHSLPAGIEWIATRVVLHYCSTKPAQQIDDAFDEGITAMANRTWSLNELAWYLMDEIFVRYPQLYMKWDEEGFSMKKWMAEKGIHYPEKLIRIAVQFGGCGSLLMRRLGDFAIPVLKDELKGAHRKSAAIRLLEMGIETEGLVDVAAEFVDDEFRRFLLDAGRDALPALKKTLYLQDLSRRVRAADLIAQIDKSFEQQKLIDTLIESFNSTNSPGLAKYGLTVIKSIGESAAPALTDALKSGDPQTIVFSLAALDHLGRTASRDEFIQYVENYSPDKDCDEDYDYVIAAAKSALGDRKISKTK